MCAVSGPEAASVSGLSYIGTTLHSLTHYVMFPI